MPDEVLSAAEVESLLSRVDARASRAAERRGKSARLKESLSLGEFKRPKRVGHEWLNSLQALHEGFAQNVGAALSSLLRCIVRAELTSVEELTYGELVFSFENPTCLNVLEAPPLEGCLLLEVTPFILYPILDRLLGGGKETSRVMRRPLTEIELRLAGKITGILLEELRRTWQGLMPLGPSVVRVESDPYLVQVVPPNEVAVRIGFEVKLGEACGRIHLCIPYNSLERIDDKLSGNVGAHCHCAEASCQSRLQAGNHQRSTLEVTVELAHTTITTSELVGLRIGDVITTDHAVHQPLQVMVAGLPRFLARPGIYKGRKAFRVEESVPDGGEPEGGNACL